MQRREDDNSSDQGTDGMAHTDLIVGIGASAGGLGAFTAFLKEMPADSGMAFVLVQHLSPDHKSALVDLLGRATIMPVREAENETLVEPNAVYVIPPNATLTIKDRTLFVARPAPPASGGARSTRSSRPWARTRAKTRSASSSRGPAATGHSVSRQSRIMAA